MDDWLMQSTTAALDRMTEHAAVVGLPNTDEATFRSFFMAALKARVPSARLETEWKWFDLLVQMSQVNALVEFKYYLHRRCIDLDGRHLPWKGGAGAQNEREFYQCVDKLKACGHSPIHVRYLVLVYETLGPEWMRPELFRIGASSLLNDILMQINKERTGRYQGPDYFTID